MELHITQPEAAVLAHRIAASTGVSVEQAVLTALREWEKNIAFKPKPLPERSIEEKMRVAKELAKQYAALPKYDDRSLEEILYDEHGLPK